MSFTVTKFEQKLAMLTNRRDSISLVAQSQPRQQIAFFHLANEILQSRRRKDHLFRDAFQPHLPEAIRVFKPHATEDLTRRVTYLLEVWDQRAVFERGFVNVLREILGVPVEAIMPTAGDRGELIGSVAEIGWGARSAITAIPTDTCTDRLAALSMEVAANDRGRAEAEAKCSQLIKEVDHQFGQPATSVGHDLSDLVSSLERQRDELARLNSKRQTLIDQLRLVAHREQTKLDVNVSLLEKCETCLSQYNPKAQPISPAATVRTPSPERFTLDSPMHFD
ncbi:hypothetical protein IWQ60_007759 [Tieghemiomyces parasiticus]|uniref:CID domain-containing protein n=1 Tax=Tieghemiomyces parasiticus TaxID=78921 RepID=A0A9W7ZZG5_9FUNG|nr:hypothetical protein IWQ60_007759 [Tieghemiomyces parasiticus]